MNNHFKPMAPQISTPRAAVEHSDMAGLVVAFDKLSLDERALMRRHHCKRMLKTRGFCCAASAHAFWLRLQALPRELRDLVYTAAFAHLPSWLFPWVYSGNPTLLPALCHVNEQTFAGSVPVFVRERTGGTACCWSTRTGTILRLLDRVPDGKGFHAINRLHVESFLGTCPHNPSSPLHTNLWSLLDRCTGLRHLRIDIETAALLHWDSPESGRTPTRIKSREEALAQFPMVRLLEWPNLRTLDLTRTKDDDLVEKFTSKKVPTFPHLAAWV